MSMIIEAGTCYFTIDYAVGLKTLLPDSFTGGLNVHGDGCVVFRYGGRKIAVIVRQRELRSGWGTIVRRAKLMTGTIILVAYSGGQSLSILKFEGGMGLRTAWNSNANPFDIESELLEKGDFAADAQAVVVRTSYYPQYMALFFALPSGVCIFEQNNYFSMRVPPNLAQHLRVERKPVVAIRSGERLFENVYVGLGYFRGERWTDLVAACGFEVGFKIFLFLNDAEEFEMIVVGYDNWEAVYEWSRSYYRLI